jgi:hypothetical protein
MINTVYTVNEDSPDTIFGVEQYSDQDINLISSFQINSTFIPTKHTVELHILTLADEILESDYNYNKYKLLQNAQSAGSLGASIITVDPVEDVQNYGYNTGEVKLLYHFINDLYSEDKTPVEFYVENISPDRTEVRLNSLEITPETIFNNTSVLKNRSQNLSYQDEFRLNFKNNDLLIITNIDKVQVGTETMVVVKLYEPLPPQYTVKNILNIVEIVSDSVVYEVSSTSTQTVNETPTLRSPNFNIELQEESVIPTGYFSYNELFSYPINNSNSQIFSTVNEKGIAISIDYTDFNNFVQFSSAQERLLNFKYKLDLIENYSNSKALLNNTTAGLSGVVGSRVYYEGLIEGIVNNFDHYERHLYYESGSSSWPKSNSTRPYINDTADLQWYQDRLIQAAAFDDTNNNTLTNTIPAYLREDSNNQNYLTFIYMIGQHFDNLWVYSKAVTDKYDADNRLDKGISKDLVAEALKNFGVKLYTSNKSIEDLFSSLIGQGYQPGDEQLSTNIVASVDGVDIEPASFSDYQKEIYKRIYHNLPLLLKAKGTERGLRALINCFGISSDILNIKYYGGRNTETAQFWGDSMYSTSSLDKVRIDHTGSLIEGDTLSLYTSNNKRDSKYTDDLHTLEIGFSPSDNIDRFIISSSAANPALVNFNIDNYIGDPRDLVNNTYVGLQEIAKSILGDLEQYDLRDYVRLIKFFDNTVFKIVKDFIPARASVDTGIIIKPHILNRSKAKSVSIEVDTIEGSSIENAFHHTSSIDTAFISSSDGGIFGANNEYITSPGYVLDTTPLGRSVRKNLSEDIKYTGEFKDSRITVSTGELNIDNTFKNKIPTALTFNIGFYGRVDQAVRNCTLVPKSTPVAVKPFVEYNLPEYFTNNNPVPSNTVYTIGGAVIAPQYTFEQPQYEILQVQADAGNIRGTQCKVSRNFIKVACDLKSRPDNINTFIIQGETYNLQSLFNLGVNSRIIFSIKRNGAEVGLITSIAATQYRFPAGTEGDVFEITVEDTEDRTCQSSITLTNRVCPLGPIPGEDVFTRKIIVDTLEDPVEIVPDAYFINNILTAEYSYRESDTVIAEDQEWITVPEGPTGILLFTGKILQLRCTHYEGCVKVIQIEKEVGKKGNKTLTNIYWSTSPKQACNIGDIQLTKEVPSIGNFQYEDNVEFQLKTVKQVLDSYIPLYIINKVGTELFTGVIVDEYIPYIIKEGLLITVSESCNRYTSINL